MRLPAKLTKSWWKKCGNFRNSCQVGREGRGGWRSSSGPGTGTGNAANSCAKNREYHYIGHNGHLSSEQGRKVGQGRGQEDKGKVNKRRRETKTQCQERGKEERMENEMDRTIRKL